MSALLTEEEYQNYSRLLNRYLERFHDHLDAGDDERYERCYDARDVPTLYHFQYLARYISKKTRLEINVLKLIVAYYRKYDLNQTPTQQRMSVCNQQQSVQLLFSADNICSHSSESGNDVCV